MHDVVSLDQERLRRAAPVAVRPDAFRSKTTEAPPLSETDTSTSSVIAAPPLALPGPYTLAARMPEECVASVDRAEALSPTEDKCTTPSRYDAGSVHRLARGARQTALFAYRGAARGAQKASAWLGLRSKMFALRCVGWLQPRSRRIDELADLAEQAKYRTLANRLNNISVLGTEEQHAIQNVSGAVRRTHQAGADIVQQGEVAPRPMFVVSGWACRIRVLPDGSRQIIGFLLPGDGIGIRGCGEPLSVTTITALTTLETVDGAPLLNMAAHPARFSGVAHAVGRASVQDEEFLVNQIVRLASPSPAARLAHLMLEMQWRLSQAGLATDREFAMPLSYDTLSQAIGVSRPNAIKAMRKLCRDRLVRFRYGRAMLSRPDVMRQMSGFTAPGSCSCGRMSMTPA